MFSKLSAEFIGTFWLVLGGCGSAVLAAAFPDVGIGLLGVSLAFGLTVLTGAYALGPISGGHFNPAVSVGLWAGGRFPAALLLPYIVAQVLGGVAGAGVLYLIASGRADFSLAGGFASNGYGAHSPGEYSLAAGLVCEVVMTFMFLVVILGTTHKRAPVGFAGLAIGLALTLIHLISIPVTNTSVNPARSTATAVFVGGWALQQLWLFWLAPVIGAAIAGFVHKAVLEGSVEEPPVTGRPLQCSKPVSSSSGDRLGQPLGQLHVVRRDSPGVAFLPPQQTQDRRVAALGAKAERHAEGLLRIRAAADRAAPRHGRGRHTRRRRQVQRESW